MLLFRESSMCGLLKRKFEGGSEVARHIVWRGVWHSARRRSSQAAKCIVRRGAVRDSSHQSPRLLNRFLCLPAPQHRFKVPLWGCKCAPRQNSYLTTMYKALAQSCILGPQFLVKEKHPRLSPGVLRQHLYQGSLEEQNRLNEYIL